MLKIGEFARICRVSAQTLRYYDAEGVLCADRIDPETGYRYYAPEKLETFRLIQTYKEAGFSLDEIKHLLAGDSSDRSALMAVKRQEIERDLKEVQSKLSLLESMSRQRERLGERAEHSGVLPNRLRGRSRRVGMLGALRAIDCAC